MGCKTPLIGIKSLTFELYEYKIIKGDESMFEKLKLKKQYKKCLLEIEQLEAKSARPQAAIVEAILTNSTPSDDDTDYFNMYTQEINKRRERLREIKAKLDNV